MVPIALLVLFEILFEKVDRKYFIGYSLFIFIFLLIHNIIPELRSLMLHNYGILALLFSFIVLALYVFVDKFDFPIFRTVPKSLFLMVSVGLVGFIGANILKK